MKITKSELKEMIREALREELNAHNTLEEGIFDSKEEKQKAYNQIIADAFDKQAPARIALEVSNNVEHALQETRDIVDDDNVASSKAAAKNFISAITAAKVAAQKNKYGMLNSVIEYVNKYNRNAMGLDELKEFRRTAQRVQSQEKGGSKAIEYLMDIVNKQMSTRIDSTIAFLKKEYSI